MIDVDVYVRGRFQDLKGSAPEIYDDYAVRSASEIFIQDDLHTLLFKPEFIKARDDVFGGRSPEFIDIRVSPRGDVFVKAPGSSDWLDTRFNHADTHVKAIAAKTQRAYQELQRSRESSPAPTRAPSPLSERHVVHEQSFPYPEVRDELESLRMNNQELRERLQQLEGQGHLDRSDSLLRAIFEQLRENQKANQALLAEIGGLREEVRKGQHDTQQSLGQCLDLLARLEEQSRLSPAQLEGLHQLREDNAHLQEELRGAREEARVANEAKDRFESALEKARGELERLREENVDLKRALREVDEAFDGRKLRNEPNPAAIRRLISAMDALEERVRVQGKELSTLREIAQAYEQAMLQQQRALHTVGETLGREVPSIEDLPGAVAEMKASLQREIQLVTDAKREVEERERALLEELGQLKPENARLFEGLAAIEDAIRGGNRGEESIPDTISRLIRELGEKGHTLEEAVEAHQSAMQKQQRALSAVGRTLRREISSIEELPGAVSDALQQAKEREADLTRRTLQAEAELSGERSLEVDEQLRSEALRRELGNMRQELVQARGEIEALKGAARKVAEQHQAEVDGLRGEVEAKGREVKKQKALARDLKEQLGIATRDLEAERRKTGLQESEIRRLGERVSFLEGQEQLDVVSAQKREVERQVRALQAQLEEKGGGIDLLTRKVERREATIESQKRDLTKAREELADEALRRSQTDLAHREEVIPLRARVQELTEGLAEAEERGRRVGETNADLQHQLKETKRELEQARLQHSSDERTNLEMAEELERMTAEKNRLEQLLGAIDQLERENHLLTAKTKSLANELEELTGPAFANLPKDLRLIIKALKSQIAELKQEQRALDEMEQRIVSLRLDLEEQTEATERSEGTVARLQRKLKAQEKVFEELDASHQAKRNKQSEVLSQLRAKIRSGREESERQIDLRNEEIGELQGEKKDLEHKVAMQATTILETQRKLDILQSNYEDVDRRNEELLERLRVLKNHNAVLSQEILKLEEERDYYQESDATWEIEFKGKSDTLKAVRRELSDIRLAVQHAEHECELLRIENKDLFALLNEHLGGGIHTLRDVDSELQHLKDRHVSELEQRDLSIAERQEEVKRLLERVRKTEVKRLKMLDERDSARAEASPTPQ